VRTRGPTDDLTGLPGRSGAARGFRLGASRASAPAPTPAPGGSAGCRLRLGWSGKRMNAMLPKGEE
jgi:hypothetical protein